MNTLTTSSRVGAPLTRHAPQEDRSRAQDERSKYTPLSARPHSLSVRRLGSRPSNPHAGRLHGNKSSGHSAARDAAMPGPDDQSDADRNPSDSELVRRAREGDRNAFGALYLRWWNPVCASLRRMSLTTELIEDTAQDTFMSAFEHIIDFDDDAPEHAFRTWVFRAAYRRAIDAIRHQAVVDDSADRIAALTPGAVDGREMIDNMIVWESAQRLLDAATEVLANRARQACAFRVLADDPDLSIPQIAKKLNQNVNTTKTHLRRARQLLREWAECAD